MATTHTSGTKKPYELDLKKLRHRYYVQLTPDQQRLVPGMLHQGTPPTIGRWLQVGAITQELAEQYYVQKTSFNTLVPGSLIQSPSQPGDTWKDVRRFTGFHYVETDNQNYDMLEIPEEMTIDGSQDMMNRFVTPALDILYPDRDPAVSITLSLFYYYGNTNGLENDLANLVRLADDTSIRCYISATDAITDVLHSSVVSEAYFTMQPDADDGFYSLVFGVQNSGGEIIDYIVLKSIIHKFIPG